MINAAAAATVSPAATVPTHASPVCGALEDLLLLDVLELLLLDAPAVPIANVPVSLIWNVNIPFSAVPLIFVFLPSAI